MVTFFKIVALACLLFVVFVATSNWYFTSPRYTGPKSDHFDGEKFKNLIVREQGFFSLVKWLLNRTPGKWEQRSNTRKYPLPPAVVDTGLVITFVNHSTVLIQSAGVNILTDPIWSMRASPVSFIGPKRHREPGIAFENLPHIDIVLVSHNHYDHMDLASLQKLEQIHRPIFLTGLGNKAYLEQNGLHRVSEIDWWQSPAIQLPGLVKITGVPAQHFSSRALSDRNSSLWLGFVIESPTHTVYFAGDTGFGPHFEQIAQRFDSIDVALLPIGAFRPRHFMSHVHTSPKDSIRAAQILQARHAIGIHHSTFALADDGQDEPIQELKLSKLAHPDTNFEVLDFGESKQY